jgi:hypothetical protein
MKTELTYPRVQAVQPLPGKKLLITFSTGDARIYDCGPLLKEEAFRALADDGFFQKVRSDPHGYAVIWSDDVDLAESELWIHGKPAQPGHGSE